MKSEEVNSIIAILQHPAGFDVELAGLLIIRPIYEHSPPEYWEVDWEDTIDGQRITSYKEFNNVQEAAEFFVNKRYEMSLGLDFDVKAMKEQQHE